MHAPAALLLAATLGLAQPTAAPSGATPKQPEAPKTEPAKTDPTKSADWPFTADKLERIASDLNFTEGPTWVRNADGKGGFFIFCEKGASRVHRWNGGSEKPTVIRENSDGAVGSSADKSGRVYQIDSNTRHITTWTVKDGKADGVKPLADNFEGKKLGGMNDCAWHSNGSVYATNATWFIDAKSVEFPHSGVLRVGADGKVTKVADGLKNPNGITFSPDWKTAYVTEFGDARIVSYPVKDDGTFGEKKTFADLKTIAKDQGIKGRGGADGIRCDNKGNVYSSGPGGVFVLTPEGKFIAHLPTGISNLSFGGDDGKTLIITTFDGVSKIGTKNPGAGW